MKNDKKIKKDTNLTVTGEPATPINTAPTDVSIRENVVLTFGRFNPPTIGHQKLVEAMHELAGNNADVQVYLSHRLDETKNLLDYNTKLSLCREAFGDCVVESDYNNLFEILESLSGTYKRVIVVVGEDRAEQFNERLALYNGDLYEFSDLYVYGVSRKKEDISSTAMREYAKQLDEFAFAVHLPRNIRYDAKNIMESLNLSLAAQRSADFKMIRVLTPTGKWIWRKEKRDHNVMNNKQGLAVSTQKPNRPKQMIKKIVVGESVSERIGRFTKKQKQFKIIQTDEENIAELSQPSVMRYFNKAADERGKAEYTGDKKKLQKRDRGLTSAVDRMHKWWGKR